MTALALTVLAEIVVVGVGVGTASPALGAVLQLGVVLLGAVAAVIIRWRVLAVRERAAALAAAASRERSRIAEDMHDAIGHQLAVVALRAAALEVRTTGEARAAAAEVRCEVAASVDRLHDVLDVLRGEDRRPAERVTAAVDRMRAAGMQVGLRSPARLDRLPHELGSIVATVVEESLTNATRHGVDGGVLVRIDRFPRGGVTVEVANPVGPRTGDPAREGTGITSLRRRVEALGGTLSVGRGEEGTFTTQAVLDGRRRIATESPDGAGGRRPALALLAEATTGLLVATLVTVLGYTVASHGAVLDPADFRALHVGMSEHVAAAILPADPARVRLVRAPDHPRGWRCVQYSDGNVPFAMATFEVCSADGRIVRLTDLRERSWL